MNIKQYSIRDKFPSLQAMNNSPVKIIEFLNNFAKSPFAFTYPVNQGEIMLQEEKEKQRKTSESRQYRDEILGVGQDKDQMLRLQHYRDRMLGLTDEIPASRTSKHEKMNMWSVREGNENILRLDEYMNELTKLQEAREQMLSMQKEGLMRLQQDREEMLKMQQDGLLTLQRDREEIMHLQEQLLAALQQGTSNEESLRKTTEEMFKLQQDTNRMLEEQQNSMLTFQKDRDDLERIQQESLMKMKENDFFRMIKNKRNLELALSVRKRQEQETMKTKDMEEKNTVGVDIPINEKPVRTDTTKESILSKIGISGIKKLEKENMPNDEKKKYTQIKQSSDSEASDQRQQLQSKEDYTEQSALNKETASEVKSTSLTERRYVMIPKLQDKTKNIDQRDFGMDVVRCAAVFLVLSIHFFLYSGYYSLPQVGVKVWIADWARCFVFVGVPLFLMITGYLKGTKKLTKAYYLGIIPILLTWIIATILCVAFKIYYLDVEKEPILWVADIFNFVGATYSWYVEMYIGIFLLCPFLNKITENMDKKQFQILLITMAALTFLPTLTNRWGDLEWNLNFLPDYWMALYPFTYYFIGSYIRKFQVKLPAVKGILFALLFAMVKGSILYYTAKGGIFVERIGDGYSDIFVVGTSVCLFLALYDLKTRSRELKRAVCHISKVSLALYLISWIFDRLLYVMMIPYFTLDNYIWCYAVFVSTSFFCSLLTATVIDRIVQWIYRTSVNTVIEWKNKKMLDTAKKG